VTDAAPPPRSLRWRLAFTGILALAMTSGTYLGYVFGVLGPDLRAEFHLSRAQLGLMTTVLFLVGGPLSLLAGRATDRLGGRRVMLAAFGVTIGAALLIAQAPTFGVVLAGAAFGGLALATGNPVTNKLIAEHVRRGGRGLTMGGKQAGVQLGAFLTGLALTPLAAALGWRAALAWSALVPALAVIGALLVIPSDPVHHERASQDSESSGGSPMHAIRWLMAYAFLMGSGVSAVNAYLPLYLVERAGASTALAGAVVATIGLVGIFSRVLWAWASERMRSFSAPLLILGIGAVAAIALVIAVESVGAWLAFVAAAVFAASAITWNAVGMLAVITASGSRRAGRASGSVTFAFYIGFVGSPVVFGWLVDQLGGYRGAWLLVAIVFAATVPVVLGWRRAERALAERAHGERSPGAR
jgi:MFS family permease